MPRDNDEEEAAARAVQQVVGGTWHLNDTGVQPSQVDVLVELADGGRIAMEVTREGEYDRLATRKAIDKRTARGDFAGESLSSQWHLSIPATTLVAGLQPALIEETLRDFERQGLESVTSPGAHPRFGDPNAWSLARVGVESAVLWNPSPPADEPKILLGSSWSVIGTPESLPEALARVLGRTDNQHKLALVEASARHLYVYLDDQAGASGLRGVWPLPTCPHDPEGVIDKLWIYAPWASSAYLHRVAPGTDEWEHYIMTTGEPAEIESS